MALEVFMAKNNKTYKNSAILLENFKNNGSLSIDDICTILNCKRQSAYNYIDRLEKKGYTFSKQSNGNKTIYSIENSADIEENIKYQPLDKDVIRKYCIMQKLQEGPVSAASLMHKFTISDKNDEYPVPIDVKHTYFTGLLDSMLNDGDIAIDTSSGKYYLTGNNIPLSLSVDIEQLYDLYNGLSNITPGIPYYKQLCSVCQKAGMLLGNINPGTKSGQNYIVYGRKHEEFDTISSYLSDFIKFDYKHKILQIEYMSRDYGKCQVLFATGMIVYCLEKDAMYVIGKNMGGENIPDNLPYIIINLKNISGISETSDANLHFNSEYFQSVFEYMFSISVEKPVDVIVDFERFANIERKTSYLKKQRSHTNIIKNTEKNYETEELLSEPELSFGKNTIRYKDKISGLSDFANYLRQFGSSVKVVEPQELKEKMIFSVKRTLERYNEEDI